MHNGQASSLRTLQAHHHHRTHHHPREDDDLEGLGIFMYGVSLIILTPF